MNGTNNQQASLHLQSRFRGCLLGGAVGDALGAPIEFIRSNDEIRLSYGPDGVTGCEEGPYGIGAVTDDTQMTLFTAEGLIRSAVRGRDLLAVKSLYP